MKAVIQRVAESSVKVEGEIISSIGKGSMVLLGVSKGDTEKDADFLAEKIVNLRIFEDSEGKMNISLKDINGEMLVVSQFTLSGDCRKGRRPSFVNAEDPKRAEELYIYFTNQIKNEGIKVQTGKFRAMMDVSLVNSGPVTFIIDSRD